MTTVLSELDSLRAERDLARDVAVGLEQQLAQVSDLAIDLDEEAAGYVQSLEFARKKGRIPDVAMVEAYNAATVANRRAASRLRAILNPELIAELK